MNNVDQTVDDVLCMDEYPKDTFDWDSRVAANFLIDVFFLFSFFEMKYIILHLFPQ